MKLLKKIAKKILRIKGYSIIKTSDYNEQIKYQAETDHWKKSFSDYQKWYKGEIDTLWGEKKPSREEKVQTFSTEVNAILTWQKKHQQVKYLQDLKLSPNAFDGLKLLDVGSGPHPSALAFENCNIFCLDPLFPEYLKAGFPYHFYDSRASFAYGFSENMPFPDNFFDAVISVNAIDHVDDFEKTADEIKRVLKPDGLLKMHIHYHDKTVTEPLELNKEIVEKAYSWCDNFKEIQVSKTKRGYEIKEENEFFALWSNF